MAQDSEMTIQTMSLVKADDWQDYALLDSGHGYKLEKFGAYILARPDSQALWPPAMAHDQWAADAFFTASGDSEDAGKWQFNRRIPESWPMSWQGLKFEARCTSFRHVGVFPEHSTHWQWCLAQIETLQRTHHIEQPRVLNLFGYTGLASLAAARAGAHVTHVDASKKAVTYARENAEYAGLREKPIRWLVEDAFKFVSRELRRGSKYDGIILDPPKHGRGPTGEVWKLEEGLSDLLDACIGLLDGPRPFIVCTVYAVRLSLLSVQNCLVAALANAAPAINHGHMESGEMAIVEEKTGRLLPTAIFARWHG